MASLAREAGVRTVQPERPWPNVGLAVDALLGTGATGAPRGAVAALLARVADLERPVIAVDGPSGLDLADGVQHGPLRAALTVTFGGYRRGHLLAGTNVGDLVVVDNRLSRPRPRLAGLPERGGLRGPRPSIRRRCAQGHPRPRRSGRRGRRDARRGAAHRALGVRRGGRAGAPRRADRLGDDHRHSGARSPDLRQPFEAHPSTRTTALLGRADAVVVGPGLRPEPVARGLRPGSRAGGAARGRRSCSTPTG